MTLVLFTRFKQALGKIKNNNGIPVVCCVLPRRGLGAKWLSKAVICMPADHCKNNGWAFIDNWDLISDKNTSNAKDGVYLSHQCVRVLAGTLERRYMHSCAFFISREKEKLVRTIRETMVKSKKITRSA